MKILITLILVFWVGVAGAYAPPTGIPDPNWTTHPIDTVTPSQPSPWTTDQSGYYYIDSSVSCSDTGDGNLSTPRCTVPTSGLSAGDKIFIKHCASNTAWSGVSGTAAAPIWIIGVDGGIIQPEQVGEYLKLTNSDWIFVDGITFDGTNTPNTSASVAFYVAGGSDYIVFRNSIVQDMAVADYNDGTGYAAWRVALTAVWPTGTAADITNVVYYDVDISDNAGGQTLDYESGRQCIISAGYVNGATLYKVSNLWVLNCTMDNNPEDAVQFGLSSAGADNTGINHAYVGNNTLTNNGENAIDLKASSDIIISHNTMSGYVATTYRDGAGSGSDGSAGVINDDGGGPLNDWWIFNTISNSRCGIRNQANGGEHYVIGNLFYELNKSDVESEPTSAGKNGGVAYWQSALNASVRVINNTIYDVHGGIYINNSANSIIENNIVSEIVDHTSGWPVIRVNSTLYSAGNNIYDDTEGNVRQDANALDASDLLDTSPVFVGAGSNNFNISESSPAKDGGVVADAYGDFLTAYSMAIAEDITGADRPQGSAWDIGAYEYRVMQSLGTVLLGQ